MIVTLTANPSLDRTILLDGPLRPGEVQSAASAREDAGGKGINVARVIAAASMDVLAVLPLAEDDPFDAALRSSGLHAHRIPIHGRVRANVTITDPRGVTTKLNLPGARLDGDDRSAVIDAVVAASEGARWLVLAGSLPPGAGADFYVDVIAAVRSAHDGRAPLIAVDTSGKALKQVVAQSVPDLIKPNDEELADLAGEELDGGGDLAGEMLRVARTLVPERTRAALVTLGPLGAVLITAEGAWHAGAPRVQVASTVGAGDSSLAGYLLAEVEGASPEDRLRRSVRYGAAAASLAGTQAPTPQDLPAGDVPVFRLN